MTWSANEIAGLAGKAARGAGAPPEQAAWFGRAAAVHVANTRAAQDLGAALDTLPKGPITELYLAITALRAMCDADGVSVGDIEAQAPDALVQSYLEALPFQSDITDRGQARWQVRLNTRTPASRGPVGRGTLPNPLIEKMRALAARTFVPETEASRQTGAGAGLLDND